MVRQLAYFVYASCSVNVGVSVSVCLVQWECWGLVRAVFAGLGCVR